MQTKILLVKESRNHEKRVALIPSDVDKIIQLGAHVFVEDSAGLSAGYNNDQYVNVGATIVEINFEQFESYYNAFYNIDIIVRVKRPERYREILEQKVIRPGTKMIGILDVLERDSEHINEYQKARIDYYSLDHYVFPANTPMDSLKEMSRIAGRLASKQAIDTYNAVVNQVVIIGLGEAGSAVSHECVIQNIPHKVITSDVSKAKWLDDHGISSVILKRHLSLNKRQDVVYQVIKEADIIITCASTPWEVAPLLIPESTLKRIKRGAVIIDLAVSEGGNVFGSRQDETVTLYNGIKIINVSGYPKELPQESSKFWSEATYYFLYKLLTAAESLNKLKCTTKHTNSL